jgi:putative NADPH-quinone reductase
VVRRIVVIQGHPDPRGSHFGHALAEAYAHGAEAAGHMLRRIEVAKLDFPLLHTKEDWERGAPPAAIRAAQDDIAWAEHLAIFYPLWLGDLPALFKGFLEQVLRPGFALTLEPERLGRKLLKGKSARIVVTMGMPALFYRWFFRAHSLKSLKRNILGFCGIGPIRASVIGLVEGDDARRRQWLETLRALGRDGR